MMSNSGPVDGWVRCQSSLRSEAAALASLTLFLDEFWSWANCEITCRFNFYVDSKCASSNVNMIRDLIPKRKYANNADILRIIRVPLIVRKFTLEHVKSQHQDDSTDVATLPFPAQLNVWCDAMATAQLDRQLTHVDEASIPNPLPPRNLLVEVRYGGQIITSHYVSRIRDAIGRDYQRAYLQTKFQWDDHVLRSVAWDAFEHCARRPHKHTVTRCKWVHDWLNVGTRRAKIGRCADSVES